MYTLHFADGEHATFGCLACNRSFVSKPALQRHFEREPTHEAITITADDVEGIDPAGVTDPGGAVAPRWDDEERSGGIKR